MLSIGNAAYKNTASLQSNDNRLIAQPAPPADSASPKASVPSPARSADAGDRVSFSPEVGVARFRESLGLKPTGKLTRKNFEEQTQSDQAGVRNILQAKLDKLAPGATDRIGAITLQQDSKGKIQVTGDWPGKTELTKSLNADTEFTKIFTRLSRNSGILSYADQMAKGDQKASLSDYLNSSETADSHLSSLLQQYSSLKNSKNVLASLVDLSRSGGKPFSMTYNNAAAPLR